MGKLRVLDLFSGIGGFSRGLDQAGGFETVAFCENNPACQRILKKHWPNVPIIEDVKRIPNGLSVDLVTAGFPCQDISYAGKGAGLAGLRSRLFWRVIRTLGLVGWPDVLLENVAALLNRGMGDVLGSLAQIGYDAEWNCIPASALGAPQLRDRVFIGASHWSKRRQRFFPEKIQRIARFSWCENVRRPEDLPQRSNLYPSKLCGGGNGISKRLDSLGNAVLPDIIEIIGREFKGGVL